MLVYLLVFSIPKTFSGLHPSSKLKVFCDHLLKHNVAFFYGLIPQWSTTKKTSKDMAICRLEIERMKNKEILKIHGWKMKCAFKIVTLGGSNPPIKSWKGWLLRFLADPSVSRHWFGHPKVNESTSLGHRYEYTMEISYGYVYIMIYNHIIYICCWTWCFLQRVFVSGEFFFHVPGTFYQPHEFSTPKFGTSSASTFFTYSKGLWFGWLGVLGGIIRKRRRSTKKVPNFLFTTWTLLW